MEVMTDIALEPAACWDNRPASNRGRTPPLRLAPPGCPCSTSWSRSTTSRPPSPIRSTGCTATLASTFPFPARITIADNASVDDTPWIAAELAAELTRRAAWCGWSRRAAAVRCTPCGPPRTRRCWPTWTSTCRRTWRRSPRWSRRSSPVTRDLAIGTRLGRGARVVRGPKREIISRCYNLILQSHAVRGLLRRAVRLQGHPRRRRRARCCRMSPTPAGSSTPSCWCSPSAAACVSTRSRWTGWTTPTAGSTSSPPRPPTSRASDGCCAASPTARSR